MLLRNSKHNNNTWGLPGGNQDLEDKGDLLQTAIRESLEELQASTVLHSHFLQTADTKCHSLLL